MRIATLSDIHANLHALEAVLADSRGKSVDKYYCLGDIVGYGASPKKCLAIVRETCEKIVFGNHDNAIIYPGLADSFNPAARKGVEYAWSSLDLPEREFFKTLEPSMNLDGLTIAHGSLRDFNEYVRDVETAAYSLEALSTKVLFVGHTHVPNAFSFDIETRTTQQLEFAIEGQLELSGNMKYLINAGSVGQPRDGDPRAAYLIYDTDAGKVDLIRVNYDIKGASLAIRKAGLSESLAKRLLTGK